MTEPHDCTNGWADADRAVPCRVCRPWHAPCTTCGIGARACRSTPGRCCPSCPHSLTRKKVRR